MQAYPASVQQLQQFLPKTLKEKLKLVPQAPDPLLLILPEIFLQPPNSVPANSVGMQNPQQPSQELSGKSSEKEEIRILLAELCERIEKEANGKLPEGNYQ